MSGGPAPASVRTEIALRVVCPAEAAGLARILRVLRKSAGAVRAHLVDRLHDPPRAFILCERPEEGARALERDGQEVETETVVTVRTPNRPGTFSHLVETLAAEEIEVHYSYSTAMEDELLIVLRTSDNPKAEDALRNFLVLPDSSIPPKSAGKSDRPSGAKVPRRQPRKGSS